VVDEGDVEDTQAVLAARGVEELAPRLDVDDLDLFMVQREGLADVAAGVLVRVYQRAAALDVLLEVVGVRSRCSELPITACGSSRSVTMTDARPCSPAATQQKRPMKFV
jgi:hypothetical protein